MSGGDRKVHPTGVEPLQQPSLSQRRRRRREQCQPDAVASRVGGKRVLKEQRVSATCHVHTALRIQLCAILCHYFLLYSAGWLAGTVASYCPSKSSELMKEKLTQYGALSEALCSTSAVRILELGSFEFSDCLTSGSQTKDNRASKQTISNSKIFTMLGNFNFLLNFLRQQISVFLTFCCGPRNIH